MALESNKEEQLEMDEEIAVKQKLNPDPDMASPSKVKFTNDGKNGINEAKIDIDRGYGGSVGMSKEELMKYANDPFWVKLRMFLFILFWVVWFAMLIGAVVIVAIAPKCAPTSSLEWWQKTTIYQVYVRSFKDSNGDGEGDLKGLISKLDYFKDIGIETLILSPIYPSEMKDSGYDVTNHTDIDPRFGDLKDFEKLSNEMHSDKRNMKLILDFIPNHTSDRHKWFIGSTKGDPKYKDYYVWHNGSGTDSTTGMPSVPNNWRSVFGGSAWTWNEERKQFYYHQFLPSQPDLNLRNNDVKNELKDVLQFWLKYKIDGFRIDAVSHLIEDQSFEDENIINPSPSVGSDYDTTDHNKTVGHSENFQILKEWREVVFNFGLKKVLITESYEPMEQLLKYYGESSDKPLIDLPFNFALKEVSFTTNAAKLKEIANSIIETLKSLGWKDGKPFRPWSALVTGNHDMSRLASRIGQRLSEGIQMFAFILPKNTPIVYYGDEIGLQDNNNIPSKSRNEGESSRLAFRSLMQWNKNTSSAGFSDIDEVVTWHNSHNSPDNNVESEMRANSSTLKVFQKLVELRKNAYEAILLGKTVFPTYDETQNVFVMIRTTDTEGQNGYLLAINLNTTIKRKISLNDKHLPEKGKIILADSQSSKQKDSEISFSDINLEPQESILVEFIPPKIE